MSYRYKPKNKYPYIVYMNVGITLEKFYDEVNPWVKENIGVYCKDWFCPSGLVDADPDGDAYAFKTKEDAMAFKLRWL